MVGPCNSTPTVGQFTFGLKYNFNLTAGEFVFPQTIKTGSLIYQLSIVIYFLLDLCCCFVKCSSCFFLLGQACHHTESLWVSSQEPIVESQFGFPTFHSEASISSLNNSQIREMKKYFKITLFVSFHFIHFPSSKRELNVILQKEYCT